MKAPPLRCRCGHPAGMHTERRGVCHAITGAEDTPKGVRPIRCGCRKVREPIG